MYFAANVEKKCKAILARDKVFQFWEGVHKSSKLEQKDEEFATLKKNLFDGQYDDLLGDVWSIGV